MEEPQPAWTPRRVRALRKHLGLTQAKMAQELGTRQATISDWEQGYYRPRGASARLLTMVAERAAFQYGQPELAPEPNPESDSEA